MVRPFPDEITLELGLDEPEDDAALRRLLARRLGVAETALPDVRLEKRSLDARRGRIRYRLVYRVLTGPPEPLGGVPLREVRLPARTLIVGDGPAGLFCAYELARAGVASIVLDRGKPVQPRRHDLKGLHQRGEVDVDSNYCFGEGGAGTYSDGKLYTRSTKRGNVRDVLEILALHGAPESIMSDARPHIGSNRLPKVVTALREHLEQVGVVFRFGARVTGLLTQGEGSTRRIAGVRLASAEELEADAVVVATGHSARDVFGWLDAAGVRLEPKPFAVGVRIEHPQPLIDRIQYGSAAGHPRLPAAAYRLAATIEGRGVFSFCMCPGGFIVPAATEPDGVVVNGMSLSRRDSPYANSGLVVSVEPRDLDPSSSHGALAGVVFQRRIEQAAFTAGGGALKAPAVRAQDFVAGRLSTHLPATSYIPGVSAADLSAVLDAGGVKLAHVLRSGLRELDRQMRGFLSEEALLVGVETRTSCPVRVPRDPVTLESPDLSGLYPCGEGAGYAGGIASSALDGMRVAGSIVSRLSAGRLS
jgi:hypothetical protein